MEKIFDKVPGDNVWVMHNNKAVCGTIEKVFYCEGISCVDYDSLCRNEEYTVCVAEGVTRDFKPNEVFTTKEALLRSL